MEATELWHQARRRATRPRSPPPKSNLDAITAQRRRSKAARGAPAGGSVADGPRSRRATPSGPGRERARSTSSIWGGLALLLIAGFASAEIGKLAGLVAGSANMRELAPSSSARLRRLADLRRPDVADGPDGALGHRPRHPDRRSAGAGRGAQHRAVWIQQPVRRLLDVLRAVPDLVVGAMFVVAVGLGPVRRRDRPGDQHRRRARQAVLRSRGGHRPGRSRACARPAPRRCRRWSGA